MSSRRPASPGGPSRSSGTRVRPSAPRSGSGRSGASRPESTRPAGREPRAASGVERPVASASAWPRILTVRSIVLFVVAMLAFVLLFPTVRAYFTQAAELQAMRQQVEDAKTRNDELRYELSRWDDDAFVAAQARERLAYVYPGEVALRVLDPESVVENVNPETGKGVTEGPVDVGFAETPWYATVWNSFEVAGTVEVTEDGAPVPQAKVPADDEDDAGEG
ncbi:septum formation initiator family protein [Sanguibacter sp. HDW7]|uniref:FtsB family cell division protein n=1 Tax=Sanguibacter sp. HDW7 TaxID=2714931 RepID=UPI001F0E397B|nr:septum formation initiator family protein [Sanguibacter sp. HDW7]